MLIVAILDHTVKAVLRLFYLTTSHSFAYTYGATESRPSILRTYCKVVLRLVTPDPARRLDKHPLLILTLVLYYRTKSAYRQGAAWLADTELSNYVATNPRPWVSYAATVASVTRASLALLIVYLALVYIHLSWQLVPFAKVLFS